MADMKVFKIEADTKDAVKNLKDIEIQTVKAISAQEVLQGILTSPEPLKNMAKYIPVYKQIGDITESISKIIPSSVKQMQEAQAIMDKGITKQLEGSKKISEANKKELDGLKKQRQKREENFEALQKEIKDRQLLMLKNKALGKEISEEDIKWLEETKEKLKKLSDEEKEHNKNSYDTLTSTLQAMQKATDDAYAQSINSIKLKYDLEAQEIRNSCDLTLAAENEKTGIKRASAENEQAMMIAQNIKLKDLESRRNAELKKAEDEHQKASASIVENFLKERTSGLEKYVDNTTKITEKNTKKIQKELGSLIEGVDKAVIESIVKQSVAQQKATTATTTATTAATTATTAATTATTAATAATAANTTTTKEATTATKEATDAAKKYLDIQGTRINYQSEIKELKDLQNQRKETFDIQMVLYETMLMFTEKDSDAQKEILAQKAAYVKQYATEIIQIQGQITATEKKEQNLSLTQWTQYAQKAGEVANNIKNVTGKVGDYLSTAFTAVSNIYKAEIASIDEEITHLQNKNKDLTQEYTNQKAEVDALAEQMAKRKNEMSREGKSIAEADLNNDPEYKLLVDKKNAEQKILDESLTKKQEIAAKERELQAKKAKKQAEQEKIEKLNRKATLIKNIGESIANIAQGVTKALSYGPILGPVLAAIVAAAGAVQVGIMTKQLAKFADGGLLKGKRHSQGGMRIEGSNIEVEGGEYVVNRESTGKNLGLVRYINSERRELKPADIESFFARSSRGFEPSFSRMMQDGGQLPVVEPANNIDNESLVQAIRSIRIEPRVAVSDIYRVQDSMVSVDGWAGV